MKAKWKEQSGGTSNSKKLVKVDLFNVGSNTSCDEFPSLVGRNKIRNTGLILYESSTRNPQELFTLANGELAVAYPIANPMGTIRVFNLDTNQAIADFRSATPLSSVEIFAEAEQMRVTCFSSTGGIMQTFFEDGGTYITSGHLPQCYLTIHQGRIAGANKDNNLVHIYNKGKHQYQSQSYEKIYVAGDNNICTGLASYKNILCYWSSGKLYKILGEEQGKYSFEFVDYAGCLSNGSIANVRGKMMWLGRSGVYEWDEKSAPKLISKPVESYVTNIDFDSLSVPPKAISWGDKYYLAITPSSGTPTLLTYDVEHQLWNKIENVAIIAFAIVGDKLVGMRKDGAVAEFGSNGIEIFDWNFKSRYLPYAKRVIIKYSCKVNAGLTLRINCDGTLTSLGTFIGTPIAGERVIPLPIDKIGSSKQWFLDIIGSNTSEIKIDSIELEV